MPQSESPMKTSSSTARKRFRFVMIVDRVVRFFTSSRSVQKQAAAVFVLPSISVTSPEGQTTVVE